jgi:hypothetical protein
MILAPAEVPTPGAEPDHAEVLIKEARRRGRHHLAIALLVAALMGAAVLGFVVGVGGNGAAPGRVHDGHSVNPIATATEWATAHRTCEGRPLQAARGEARRPHLYGAYPTDVRLAVNWPSKIYPLAGPPTPTTITPAGQPKPHYDPWDGYNTSRPATICIFTGSFRSRVPSMQGIFIQHAKVLVMQLLDIPPEPNAISIYPMNAVPNRPVPVAG